MSRKTDITKKWALASFALADAVTDFVLSRQAKQCSPATMRFYSFTVGKFTAWIETRGITAPSEITARHVRAYLAELTGRGLKDTYIHGHARAIKTLLRFWHVEGYMPNPTKFDMPKLAKRRLPMLSADEVKKVLAGCDVRGRAILLLMVDTGLRRAEVTALNWGDVNMLTGVTQVRRGKGGKARTVIIGVRARRALLAYRRTCEDTTEAAPVIQANDGTRFTDRGLSSLFQRMAKKTGVKFSPHALRRTFCILALRAGMPPTHVQALLGHETITMTMHYAQMVDDDLLAEHRQHSPVDRLIK